MCYFKRCLSGVWWICLSLLVANTYFIVTVQYKGKDLLPLRVVDAPPAWRHVRRCHVTPRANVTFPSTDITDKGPLDKRINMTCKGCFPSQFHIMLWPTTVCDTYGGQTSYELTVLVIILSMPGAFEHRQNVRYSWARATSGNTSPYIRHLFLLGEAASEEEQIKIVSEQGKYNDISQKNIPEDLGNIGLKTIMGLQWAVDQCHRAAYILKTDMDSFVSVPQLMAAIASVGPEVGLFGHCKYDGVPVRNPEHKHHMTRDNYPAAYNPPYCFGAGYVLSMSAAQEVVQMAPDLSPVRLEDVFIGLCLREARFRGRHQHRIHDMSGFLDMSWGRACCDLCHWGTDRGMYSKVIWHVANASFLKRAWQNCFKLQCDSTPGGIALK